MRNRNYTLLVLALLAIVAIGAYGLYRKHRFMNLSWAGTMLMEHIPLIV